MKKFLLTGLFLLGSVSGAFAQCDGNLPIGTICAARTSDIAGPVRSPILRSGAAGTLNTVSLGRTTTELVIGVAGAINDITTGTVAGDSGVIGTGNLWLGLGSAGGNIYVGRGTLGSVWPNVVPNDAITVRLRDRLFVDDGTLSDGTSGSAVTASTHISLANTRSGTAINNAGGGWRSTPWLSSVYVLSSTGNAAIAGQTTTSLHVDPDAQSTIGVIGMALADHPTLAFPAFGMYSECRRVTAPGSCYAVEHDVGNLQSVVVLESYRGFMPTLTVGVHTSCGGSSVAAYTNCSAAYDVEGGGAPFDRGIVYRNNSVADQGGGVFNAINFPTNYRINWFRNDGASRDQLQAYVTASNTTTGTVVGHDILGLDFVGQGAGAAHLYAENLVVRSSSTNNASVQIGVSATGDRQSALLFYSKLASAGDAYFIRNPGTNGKFLFTQVGTGTIEVTASSGMALFSGASGTFSAFGVGRTASEVALGVSAGANNFVTGTVAGDAVVLAQTNLFLAANGSGTAVGIKLTGSSSLTTLPGALTLLGQITSTLATGTAPFVVASATNVANLNASSLNGATFAAPGAIGGGTPSTGAFTTLTASTSITSLLHVGGTTASSTLTLESTSGAGTSDAISFVTGSQVTRGTIGTLGNWSIGPNAPAASIPALLDLNKNASSVMPVGTSAGTALLRLVNADGTDSAMEFNAFGTAGSNNMRGAMAGGTLASPSALASGKNPWNLVAYAHDGTAYRLTAAITMATTETQSGTNRGINMQFNTTPTGSATLTEGLRLLGGSVYMPNLATTASAANVFVDNATTPANELKRVTSSARYKKDVAKLDYVVADKLLQLGEPIQYRSKISSDDQSATYFGFIAEKMAEIDSRFVIWSYADEDKITEVDGDGRQHVRIKSGAKLIPDSVGYDRLTVPLLAIAQNHETRIANLEKKGN